MCLKQNFSYDQLQTYVKELIETNKLPNRFVLTDEQLVRIAIEENISLAESICLC